MRIEEVRATAFGPYQDQTLTLSPGMNVLHGPNEAGKSSWFAALYAGLAGQRTPRSNASGATEFASRHRPWAGSRWSAGVVVAMDDGTRLSFTHDLRSGRAEILDVTEDTALTIEELEARFGIPLTTDSVLDGTRLVGLNRDSARATTFIGQADVLRVLADADELREAMERVAASRTQGTDADQAWARLTDHRHRLDDDATLDRVSQEARTATEGGLARLAQLNEVVAQERATAAEKAASQKDLDLIRTAERWADIHQLTARLVTARELRADLDDASADPAADAATPPSKPMDLPDQFTNEQLEQFATLLESAPSGVDQALVVERSRLKETPADEAEVDLAWVRYHEAVERNVAARKAHKAALKQHAKAEKSYHAERAAFDRAHGAPAAVSEWQLPTFFGGVLIVEILIFAFVSNALGLAIGVLGIIGLLFLRRSGRSTGAVRSSSDKTVDGAPTPPGPAPAEPEYESEEQPEETPRPDGDPVASQRLLELDTLLSTQETEATRGQAERDEVVASLERAGIEPKPAAVRALMGQIEANAAAPARPKPGNSAHLSTRLAELLGGSTIPDLEQRIASLEAEAGPEPSSVPSDLVTFRGRARDRHDEVTEKLGDLRGQRAGLSQSLPVPAELIEAEGESQRHAARTQDFRALLDVADSELRLARDRGRANIAPAVEARIKPWLPRITGGRYVDATVSPEDLTIQVTDEAGQVREAGLLSQGTTEQVFLLLRVALAQVLGGGVEESTPLVLDDVTVQSDQIRTSAILDLLHELSAEHQVVLFTQEHEVITWAQEHLDRGTDQLMALTPASDLSRSQRALF